MIGEAVNGPDGYFASGMDGLYDSLSGGMGQPDDGRRTFVWTDSETSRSALGYHETVRQPEQRLWWCHPSNVAHVRADLQLARAARGPTAFDWLMGAFRRSPADLVLR